VQILAKEFNRSVHARDSGEHVTCCWSVLLLVCRCSCGECFGDVGYSVFTLA
jgi:hypothetical protein